MSRPTKFRRVCHLPDNIIFVPSVESGAEDVILTIDEYETIRLIDYEGLSQEECGAQLQVGRTTAQKIYEMARGKLAQALILGARLRIEGGQYSLCNGHAEHCYRDDCHSRQPRVLA